jgi:hypothetical protein
MEDRTAQTISAIDEKLKGARPADLRFFRVEEFKRNVERAGNFSGKCPVCTKEQVNIREVTGKIDQAIAHPGKDRRDYDRLIGRLATHMQKEHGYYSPNYFTYRYSFYGMIAGAVVGYLLMMLLSKYNWAYFSGGFSVGLLIGYVYGGRKDRKIRQKKMLM